MRLKNRFARAATWENMATETGHLTPQLIDIYKELAKNNVALIITGYANILQEEKPNAGMMGIYDDSFIKEYKALTDLVHGYDSKIIRQIAYGGTKTTYNLGERVIFAPSTVAEKSTGTIGKEMTIEDISQVTKAFAAAALRAKKAGFDGVEIHGAHSYLINQFLSPFYNKRNDQYGGNLKNRSRFLREICSATRTMVGDDFPIIVKLTASDFFEGGLQFSDTLKICKMLEEMGVNALDISGNIHGKAQKMAGKKWDSYEINKEGYFVNYAAEVKKRVDMPIITVGGFRSLDHIEELHSTTGIDIFSLARPLLTEPHLIRRWENGDTANTKCIRCSLCRTDTGNYCTVFTGKTQKPNH